MVQIAKGAATATASNPPAEASAVGGEIQNRAGKVESTEKRKADELETGGGGMDVDQSETIGEEAVEGSEEARAAKQQRI